MTEMKPASDRNRAVWSAGDWDAVADLVVSVGQRLLDELPVEPGTRLLDVGTGSGGAVAIPAARRGAQVTGVDITDAWFPAGRRRAAEAGVSVEWVVGDAAALPFDDESFDVVTSTFGHMFAPDHSAAARELHRVCRAGGSVGLCCWTPGGNTGKMFRRISAFMPPPPPGFQPPPLWGDEEHVRSLLEPLGFAVDMRRDTVVTESESPAALVEQMERHFPPFVSARGVLGERWPEARAEFAALIHETNEADDGSLRSSNEYLRILATRA